MGDYANDLFEAVQVLIDANKDKSTFDTTYKCKIVDNSEAASGKYKVTSNNELSWFYAYSENTDYKIGDRVRVTVPGNNWSNPKYIDGKLQDDESGEPIAYVPPLEQMVPGGEGIEINDSWGLIANEKSPNKEETDIKIGIIEGELTIYQIPNIYDTIGIQASFKTMISPDKLAFGAYWLAAAVTYSYPEENKANETITYKMISDDMFGNPYHYLIPTAQQMIITTPKGAIINKIELSLHQNGEFAAAAQPSVLLKPKEIKDIICSDIQVYIGNDVANYEDNTVKLYSLDGLTYDNTADSLKKTLGIAWFNKSEENEYLGYSDGLKRMRDKNSNPKNPEWVDYNPQLYGKDETYEGATNPYHEEEYLRWSLLAQRELDIYNEGRKNEDEQKVYLKDQAEAIRALAGVEYIEDTISNIEKIWSNFVNITKEAYNAKGGSITDNPWDKAYKLIFVAEGSDKEFSFSDMYETKENEQLIGLYPCLFDYLINKRTNQYSKAKNYYKAIKDKVNNFLDLNISNLGDYKDKIKTYQDGIRYQFKTKIQVEDILEQYLTDNKMSLTQNANYPADETAAAIKKYDNHYSIYLFRKTKNYDGSENFVDTSSWKKVECLDKEFLPPSDRSTIKKYEKGSNTKVVANLQKSKDVDSFYELTLQPENLEDKYKVVIFYNHERYESEVLTFEHAYRTNEELKADYMANAKIKHGDNSQSNYQIYDPNGELTDSSQSELERWVYLEYTDPSTGIINNDKLMDCLIVWRLPNNSNLRHIDEDDQFNKLYPTNEEKMMDKFEGYFGKGFQDNDNTYYEYNTAYVNSSEKGGRRFFHYSIPESYITNLNDTITCMICEPGAVWIELDISIGFMRTGDSGTPYSLQLNPIGKRAVTTEGTQYKLTCTNQSGKEMKIVTEGWPDENTVVIKYIEENGVGKIYTDTGLPTSIGDSCIINPTTDDKEGYEWTFNKNNQTILIKRINGGASNRYGCLKIVAQVKFNNNFVDITKYFPLGLVTSGYEDYYFQAPTVIKYNSMGGSPQYNKSIMQIKNYKTGQTYNNIVFKMRWYYLNNGKFFASAQPNVKYSDLPTLDDSGKTLRVSSIYIKREEPAYAIIEAIIGDKVYWTQSIFISQDKYTSDFLNNWDGNYQLDKTNNTLMSAMLGAGIKNTDDSFSGVLMGDISIVDGGPSLSNATPLGTMTGLGLYGYHNGAQSFGFNVDGTAFIGPATGGRIWFDGNKGLIASQNWFASMKKDDDTMEDIWQNNKLVPGKAGMAIDLVNGHIDAYNFTLTAGTKGAINQFGLSNSDLVAKNYWKTSNTEQEGNYIYTIQNWPNEITNCRLVIGQKFIVTANGTLYASDGIFSGDITGATGTFGGLISGGEININNKFIVNKEGEVTATSGKIGGIKLDSIGLTSSANELLSLSSSFYGRLDYDNENEKAMLSHYGETDQWRNDIYEVTPEKKIYFLNYPWSTEIYLISGNAPNQNGSFSALHAYCRNYSNGYIVPKNYTKLIVNYNKTLTPQISTSSEASSFVISNTGKINASNVDLSGYIKASGLTVDSKAEIGKWIFDGANLNSNSGTITNIKEIGISNFGSIRLYLEDGYAYLEYGGPTYANTINRIELSTIVTTTQLQQQEE